MDTQGLPVVLKGMLKGVLKGLSNERSVATQLMLRVFLFYCLIAIVVTFIHIVEEYRYTQTSIEKELQSYENIFGSLLGRALWDLDRDQIQGLLNGLSQVPVIVGVKIERLRGDSYEVVGHTGTILDDLGHQITSKSSVQTTPRTTNPLQAIQKPTFSTMFSYQFPIHYQFLGGNELLGRATLFSDSTVVLKRVQLGFAFLLINALIKGAALWFIFLWFSKKLLLNPLDKLTKAITQVKSDTLSDFHVDLGLTQKNELTTIEESFSSMVTELGIAQRKILAFNEKLEDEVDLRTAELIGAKNAAEAGVRAKNEFLSIMSHEIRTPINSIMGMLNILSRTEMSKKQQQCSEMALSGTQSLLKLVSDILDYSRFESGGVTLNITDIDITYHASEYVRHLGKKAQEKGVELILDVAGVRQGMVQCDAVQLQRIYDYLLDNAIKFTEQGTVIFQLKTSHNNDTWYLIGNIKDTGIGIAEDKISSLFTPFSQVDSSINRSYEGIGLGLALTKQLCNLMGGSISATSVKNKGSCFCFEIPLSTSQRETPFTTNLNLEGNWVLIVDASSAQRENLRTQLENKGAVVLEALMNNDTVQTKMDTVLAIKGRRLTVIIDASNADTHTETFVQSLRNSEKYKMVNIIVMTSVIMEEQGNSTFETLEGITCIAKPITPITLYSAFTHLNENKQH